jgi:hypothetical protein
MLLVDRRNLYDVLRKATFVLLCHTASGEKSTKPFSNQHPTLGRVKEIDFRLIKARRP